MVEANRALTFGLVHGAWHGAWVWDSVRPALESLGYESVAVDLPLEDLDADFDDYASVTASALKNEANLVLVGHSRAANVIPRVAGRLSVQRLIYLCPSFDISTTKAIGRPDSGDVNMPHKYSAYFEASVTELANGLTVVDPVAAEDLFYNDCTKAVRLKAVARLRATRGTGNQPNLEEWPATPLNWIICDDDKAIRPEWSTYVAKNWLSLDSIDELPGGHSPFLSRPYELARKLVALSVGGGKL